MSSDAFRGAIPLEGLPEEFAMWLTKFVNDISEEAFEIPSGSKLIFPQSDVPTGWVLDLSNNDVVIRITSTQEDGGTTGGNWTLSGMSVDGHTLTESEIPSHTHTLNNATSIVRQTAGANYVTAAGAATVSTGSTISANSTGGGGSHTHGLTNSSWRPAYVDSIICTKA